MRLIKTTLVHCYACYMTNQDNISTSQENVATTHVNKYS